MSDDMPTPEPVTVNYHDGVASEEDICQVLLLLRQREAEIATLRQERDEAIAEKTRALIHGTVKGFTAGENANAKAWRQRAEAAEAENARLRAVHAKAVEQIETFLVTDDDNGMALLLSISALLAPPAETDHE